jgi:DNA polymerase elongation subunit (family B)
MESDALIIDIETKTFGRPDPEKDMMKFFGCYSYKSGKFYMLTNKNDIQRVINAHKYIIGFNHKMYDLPILKREGINLDYKIPIDLMEIFKKRASSMKTKKGMLGDLLMSYSLDFITKTLDLVDDGTKGKIDFNIFKKDSWTPEELATIREYLELDIMLTKKLYEWCEDYFESFKGYVTEDDVRKKVYLTASTASFTYKVMCKELGMEAEFANADGDSEMYEGGYVAYPAGEKFEDNMCMLDYSSLYPSIFIQCNLFSHNCTCCTQEEKWHGKGFFKVDGYYCTKKQGPIEELYKKLFLLKKEYTKTKSPFAYITKLLLNSGYGVTANPCFKNMYNKMGASDCCAIGRQMILYTRKRFREEGYKNLMSDTDSVVVKYPDGKTVTDAVELGKKIVLELQEYVSFPW